MKWISIEESLPKTVRQFERFIVATEKGVGVAVYDNIYGFNNVTLSGGTQHSHLKVSHWMPLPEHPVR
ncbi:DUF551 domain-containing protein [Pantoea agglomerans]|jgi:hypothetical protein|uniref:DUF551 domain-containing protein n=1 Tax=Enterobacter agglomerans TaxID=549 RepID=UPI001786AF0B|nr:DUF551 domain-containing protein [Pantoea agglomerans]MBD8250874.1 DUF551 domain-containing protein [Pantoea agglomerans]MDY0997387.1 DUF551 domain-containing protein [Pantoea agglomerans]WAB85964.1 DUF551 domain-containing protein [Pantoea agglomerans]